jgi:hypothetical protein
VKQICIILNSIETNIILLKYIVSVKYLESDFQQYFSYIMAASFVGGGNRRNPEKTTDLPQVTDF